MGLFNRTADKLNGRTVLLFAADPGDALTQAVRLYDPGVRSWPGRLIFANGVLLNGPVTVTPKLQQQAGLPEGMAVACYAGAALQGHAPRRAHEDKRGDGDLLVQGLASRLGGTVTSAGPLPDPEVTLSVRADQAVPPEQVIELLRPYDEGDFKVQDQTKNSYSVSGVGTRLLVNYWSPQLYAEQDAPPALGRLRSRPLHHWDLSVGRSGRRQATTSPAGPARRRWRWPTAAAVSPWTSTGSRSRRNGAPAVGVAPRPRAAFTR
jgi:hypothetical protein